MQPEEVDMYPIINIERCPVCTFLHYLAMLLKSAICQSFYLQPKKKYSPGLWYLNIPAGVKKLRDAIKDMAKKAGLPGFCTNHSLRSTAATRMYRSNIDEQLVMEITGHRSLAV